MALPKRKNNISVYQGKELLDRRQELLDRITKADTYLPEAVLHDDLDYGMLEYVEKNFVVISDGEKIPVLPTILTIQRWGEIANNWTFADEDGNMMLPFISIVRNPDVQPGSNPSIQRTIPDRKEFHYATVKTWDGVQIGADVYKMPQPVPVDITYDVTIVCQKFRDLNKLNKIILQKFSARQSYTTIKGHYVPIILEKINDNSPIDAIDGRRFYLQSYTFILLGFLIDPEEFEVKPAVNRAFLLNEFMETKNFEKKFFNKKIEITTALFEADGETRTFSVGESIGFLFYVTVNGLIQKLGTDYFHIAKTSRISFNQNFPPPIAGSVIAISYYANNKGNVFIDNYGKVLHLQTEYFVYDGSSLTFTVSAPIDSIVHLEINGLIEHEGLGYDVSDLYNVTLKTSPVVGSTIGICYMG